MKHLIVVAEQGFPFSNLDLWLMVKVYLDQIPGENWARSFLKCHAKELTHDYINKLTLPELR